MFFEQAGIANADDRVSGKTTEETDLLIGEKARVHAFDVQYADHGVIVCQRHRHKRQTGCA